MGMDRIVRSTASMEQLPPLSSTQRHLLIIKAQADRIKALEEGLAFAYVAIESLQAELKGEDGAA